MSTLLALYDEHLLELNIQRITKTIRLHKSLAYDLCEYVANTPVSQITYKMLKGWFGTLSYFQQLKAKQALERFFNELIAEGCLSSIAHNPFGKATGRLYTKEKPPKERCRLTKDEYVAIRNSAIADQCLWFVHAMDLAYLLKLRRADIVTLKFKSHDRASKTLSKTILKSVNMNGADKGYTLKWDLTEPYGKDVSNILAATRSTRLIELRPPVIKYRKETEKALVECSPYVIHRRPEKVASKPNKEKTHHTQVTEALLSLTFKKYRDTVHYIAKRCDADGSQPPTFHEIRSLSARNDYDKGMDKADISKALAHSVNTITDLYLDEQVVKVTTLNTMADFG